MTKTTTPRITPAHRDVLERLEDRGGLSAAHAQLYPELADLAALGLAIEHEDGSYSPASAKGRRAPPGPTLATLNIRVPEEWIPLLEAIGPNKSEAARAMLGKALGKDTMPAYRRSPSVRTYLAAPPTPAAPPERPVRTRK